MPGLCLKLSLSQSGQETPVCISICSAWVSALPQVSIVTSKGGGFYLGTGAELGSLLRRISRRLDGSERFHTGGRALDFDVTDFWRWSLSDHVSNATRGRLAEYIVARALDIPSSGVRDEWAAS
jgi:hypothetical protein